MKKVSKKVSKKQFRNLLTSVACGLITATKHGLICDVFWVSKLWQGIAREALLNYPQEDYELWVLRDNYLSDLCKTLHK